MPQTGELVFNNPVSPMEAGVKCDRCGTPANNLNDLVEQDGFLRNKTHRCLKAHNRDILDYYSSGDDEEFPLRCQFGGRNGIYTPRA